MAGQANSYHMERNKFMTPFPIDFTSLLMTLDFSPRLPSLLHAGQTLRFGGIFLSNLRVIFVSLSAGSATLTDRRAFLDEINMMKQLGKHLNIVSMLGCVTTGGPLSLIIEYCPYGDLRDYLRLIRDKVRHQSLPDS